jgi:LAO/AO transport system ATPase
MIAALLDRLRQGDRKALARLVSHAARGEHLAEMQAAFGFSDSGSAASLPRPPSGRGAGGEGGLTPAARVVAFTGSAGVGKSSLIGKLISVVRAPGNTVAVLACDPQSPLSGGALLGDRFRMGNPLDDGVFIRSLAALSGHGALADHLDVMIRLLETFGFDVIFLETVGSGQADVEVRNLADVVVLLLQPESGDDVQWEKAGILECTDVVAVHKADLPTAEQTAAQVRAALELSPSRNVPVLRVSTKANQGHAELWQAIQTLPLRRRQISAVRLLLQLAQDWLEKRFQAAEKQRDPEFMNLVETWQCGETAMPETVHALLRHLVDHS